VADPIPCQARTTTTLYSYLERLAAEQVPRSASLLLGLRWCFGVPAAALTALTEYSLPANPARRPAGRRPPRRRPAPRAAIPAKFRAWRWNSRMSPPVCPTRGTPAVVHSAPARIVEQRRRMGVVRQFGAMTGLAALVGDGLKRSMARGACPLEDMMPIRGGAGQEETAVAAGEDRAQAHGQRRHETQHLRQRTDLSQPHLNNFSA
jgi:hypothetical protein